ncbi:hypothetical protein FVEN_g13008 [Fusarium venenatum]|uniref:Uncharacterized protein n=1 Tax=Fusarium venenatum TaxID=56646 RepID=A0A2L2SVG3_9HYPO|nr:uncharacterized protein FVRRES_04944 [Fusarium venenatum]KAG8351997.1 hypothetical protein FVEN_g13008 [Fusarium venenatum]KAH6992072.1 hypothetical protein EDB82DRAFT_495117 [Fusarium venenatum]CEI60508.1 unnamed protein product [Fusarium venenatum]
MLSETYLGKPLRGAPLCKKHFQEHVLGQTSKSNSPTRIQPRRLAKDKHLLTKTDTKKRYVDEDLLNSITKRRKTDSPVSQNRKLNSFANLLERQVSQIAELAAEKGPHNCSFGPAPWECHMCASHFTEFVVEKLAIVKPVAPVANMATVGKVLQLNSRMDFGEGEMITFQWEGLSYVIDACRTPMFMIL